MPPFLLYKKLLIYPGNALRCFFCAVSVPTAVAFMRTKSLDRAAFFLYNIKWAYINMHNYNREV